MYQKELCLTIALPSLAAALGKMSYKKAYAVFVSFVVYSQLVLKIMILSKFPKNLHNSTSSVIIETY